jgi:hypothetical protein
MRDHICMALRSVYVPLSCLRTHLFSCRFSICTGAAAVSHNEPHSARIAAASEALTRGSASGAALPAAPDVLEGTATTRRGAAGGAAARWLQTARQAGAARLRSVRIPSARN